MCTHYTVGINNNDIIGIAKYNYYKSHINHTIHTLTIFIQDVNIMTIGILYTIYLLFIFMEC